MAQKPSAKMFADMELWKFKYPLGNVLITGYVKEETDSAWYIIHKVIADDRATALNEVGEWFMKSNLVYRLKYPEPAWTEESNYGFK